MATRVTAPLVDEAKENDPLFRVLQSIKDEIAEQITEAMDLKPAVGPFTDDQGQASFTSVDGKTQFLVQVSESRREDGPVLWMACPYAVVGMLGPGGRVNVFQRSTSYAPNLDIEIYHWSAIDKLFMYVNLCPRRSLIDNPDDLQRFYLTAAPGGDKSWHDLYTQCEADPAYEPFRTKDAYTRALTGATSLMYTIDATEADAEGLAQLLRQATQLWLAGVQAEDVPRPQSDADKKALATTDARLIEAARLDPDALILEKVVGPENLRRIFALLCREPAALK